MKDSPRSNELDAKKEVNKELVIRALTDPKSRELLVTDPAKALGVARVTATNEREIRLVLDAVKRIEHQISSLADELLCANMV